MISSQFLRLLEGILAPVDRVVGWLVTACMAAVAAVITLQVILRYGFNSSVDWGWAVPRLAFICGIFFGIPLGLRDGVHVGIDLLRKYLPPRWAEALRLFQLFLSAVLMAVVLFYSSRLTVQLWDQTMPTLPISVGVFYGAVAFSAAHCLLHIARAAIGPPLPEPQMASLS